MTYRHTTQFETSVLCLDSALHDGGMQGFDSVLYADLCQAYEWDSVYEGGICVKEIQEQEYTEGLDHVIEILEEW